MQFFVFPFTFFNSNFSQQCNELNKIITQVNKSQLPFVVILRLDYKMTSRAGDKLTKQCIQFSSPPSHDSQDFLVFSQHPVLVCYAGNSIENAVHCLNICNTSLGIKKWWTVLFLCWRWSRQGVVYLNPRAWWEFKLFRNWMGVSAMLVYKNSPRYRYCFMGALSCNYKEILISGY